MNSSRHEDKQKICNNLKKKKKKEYYSTAAYCDWLPFQ